MMWFIPIKSIQQSMSYPWWVDTVIHTYCISEKGIIFKDEIAETLQYFIWKMCLSISNVLCYPQWINYHYFAIINNKINKLSFKITKHVFPERELHISYVLHTHTCWEIKYILIDITDNCTNYEFLFFCCCFDWTTY